MDRMPKQALAKRISQARDLADLTLKEIGDHFGISPQAVQQWENEEDPTTPKPERLSRFAGLTGVRLDWLMTGVGEPQGRDSTQTSVIAVLQAERGRRVPKITAQAAASEEPINRETPGESVITHFPCGPNSFAMDIADKSNAPEFLPGDTVVIDPDEQPSPGDMVLAAVGSPAKAVFRQYAVLSGSPSGVGLSALNDKWESFRLFGADDCRVIGVMTEHAKPRR
jgi:SOS-response transcriptional repressor LexA